MNALLTRLMNEEAGFIISAELVLVATIAVLAMVVGDFRCPTYRSG